MVGVESQEFMATPGWYTSVPSWMRNCGVAQEVPESDVLVHLAIPIRASSNNIADSANEPPVGRQALFP